VQAPAAMLAAVVRLRCAHLNTHPKRAAKPCTYTPAVIIRCIVAGEMDCIIFDAAQEGHLKSLGFRV
jgi:hypothetical protein